MAVTHEFQIDQVRFEQLKERKPSVLDLFWFYRSENRVLYQKLKACNHHTMMVVIFGCLRAYGAANLRINCRLQLPPSSFKLQVRRFLLR